MRALIASLGFAAALVADACAVGPSTRLEPAPAGSVTVTDSLATPRTRRFLDSIDIVREATPVRLDAARRALGIPDSTAPSPDANVAPLASDTSRDALWSVVFRDPQLRALINEATSNNRGLRYARSVVRQSRALVTTSRGPLFPQLSATAYRSTTKAVLGPLGFSYNAVNVTGDVSWSLDVWGATRRQIEATQFDLRRSEEEVRDSTLSIASSVAIGYLNVILLDADMAVSEQTLMAWQKTLSVVRARFARGVISELDVRQFEADLGQPAANIAEFARQRTLVENRLSQLLGRPPGTIARGWTLLDAVKCLTVPDSVPGALIARRPDVVASHRSLQAALAQVGVTVANRLPSVNLTSSYGTQRPTYRGLFARPGELYSAGLVVSVPLFTGGQLAGRENAARAQADQAEAVYEQTVLIALGQASNALAGVHSYRDQAAAQATQVQALERALEIAQRRYLAGVQSSLDLLSAQRNLYAAQLALAQARAQFLESTIQLYEAVGGTWTGTSH
jgi:multidrug efflux system outer membrane protein